MSENAPLRCPNPDCELCQRYAEVMDAVADSYAQKGDTEKAERFRVAAVEYRQADETPRL